MEVPINEKIRNLKDKRKELIGNLERCDLDIVMRGNRQLRKEIDSLYDIMQHEVDAKTYVTSNSSVVTDYIEHAARNNRKLIVELDQASQNYVFHNNEVGRARNFQYEIEKLDIANDNYKQKIADHQAIYSEVATFYQQALNILEDIENEQVMMDQTVIAMHRDLDTSEQAFEDFDFKMRTYKRFVEKRRLPGLPKEYLDYFFLVSDHIERLSVELSKFKVDTVLLQQYVHKINQEVLEVANQTNALIRTATLAEQLIQYTGKYRKQHNLQDTLAEATMLFNNFNYQQSLDVVEQALEAIEPGAVERIEKTYDKTKEIVE